MLGENPEVLHDQLRMGKYPGVEALHNEVSCRLGGQGDQKGVIDIALSILPDGQNFAGGGEVRRSSQNRIHIMPFKLTKRRDALRFPALQ